MYKSQVRAHTSITAQKLVEFSDYNVSLGDILVSRLLLYNTVTVCQLCEGWSDQG